MLLPGEWAHVEGSVITCASWASTNPGCAASVTQSCGQLDGSFSFWRTPKSWSPVAKTCSSVGDAGALQGQVHEHAVLGDRAAVARRDRRTHGPEKSAAYRAGSGSPTRISSLSLTFK